MTEIIFPSQLKHAKSTFRYVDSTGLVRGAYTGAAQTTSYGGDRVGASIDIPPVGGVSGKADRAVLTAWLASLKGKQNRAWMWDQSYTQRGSFPSGELIPNNTFSAGTSGWTAANCTLSASDRVLRLTRNVGNTSSTQALLTTPITAVQYSPYVARAMMNGGSVGMDALPSVGITDNADTVTECFISSSGFGLKTVACVPRFTDLQIVIGESGSTAQIAGAFIECAFASLSRCALVDNGVNLLVRSDQFDNAAWGDNKCSISANVGVAPDGTTTADALIEDSTTGDHYVIQASITVGSGAQDFCLTVAAKATGRNFTRLDILHSAGTVSQIFNLNTGAVGATSAVGTDWGNLRAFISPLGGGWYQCSLIARKTGSETSLSARIAACSIDSLAAYLGNGASALQLFRATLSPSSVSVRLTQTTSAAITSASQTGNGLYLKGLPVGTNGLFLIGDWVQVGNQPVLVSASLNSDTNGLGYLQFSPPVRISPADNDPVIPTQPMGKFIFSGQFPQWANDPGVFTTASLDFEESCD